MRRIGIAFVIDYFVLWTGGATLLGSVLAGVLRAAPMQGVTVRLLISRRVLPLALPESLPSVVGVPAAQFAGMGALGALVAALPADTQFVVYQDLRAALDTLGIDVVGPTGFDLGTDLGRPWFGYIPDFQHQYLADYFSQAERRGRDVNFRTVVENAVGVFVNSATVSADIARFYPGASRGKRILRFPQVYPDVSSALTDRRAETRQRLGLGLGDPYLISCSQRWLHKQHDLLVTGFADFLAAHPTSPLHLVFTGETHDHRDPAHAGQVERLIDERGLRDRVHQVGLVARADQLQLLAGAHALLTATRFEGGPGASGAVEAAMLGTPVVASDIEPNRELNFGRTVFFDGQRSRSLADALGVLGTPQADAQRQPLHDAPQIATLTLASGLQMIAALRAAVA